MKARYIYDINDTLVFINEYIQDKMFSYDAVKEHIDAYNGRDWTLEITNIDDDDEFERVSDFFEDELFGEVDYDAE